jgi:hypothetical protein
MVEIERIPKRRGKGVKPQRKKLGGKSRFVRFKKGSKGSRSGATPTIKLKGD